MTVQRNAFDEFLSLAKARYPQADFDLLIDALFSEPLTPQAQHLCLQLVEFARSLQTENPLYEAIYQHLLHLYVLNGSRLEQLKIIDRRLRGLLEGQGALLLVSGVSGIGKTSLVMAFQERVQQLGAAFIAARGSEQRARPIHCGRMSHVLRLPQACRSKRCWRPSELGRSLNLHSSSFAHWQTGSNTPPPRSHWSSCWMIVHWADRGLTGSARPT